jgi:Fe-S-cluster containining protein
MSGCTSCGACCFSTLETYLRVTGEDYARLGDRAAELVAWRGNRAYMRMEDGRCAALRVDRAAGRFLCAVYDERPEICRALQPESRECEGERATKGDRPRRALALI